MSHAHCFFTLLQLVLVFSTEGALYGLFLGRCQFSSPTGRDAVYLEQYYFNKVLFMQYNSTLGTTVGYTEKGKLIAEYLNSDPKYVSHEKWKTRLCKEKGHLAYDGLLNPVKPYVTLRSFEEASGNHPGMLVCSAYNFYPKQIKVTWLKDGKEVMSDVTSTDELPTGNWLYQIHTYLEYTPRLGQKITCMVEHASHKEPKYYDWDPTPDPGINKIAVGTAGLLLGVFFSLAGLIYYKRESCVNHLGSPGSSDDPPTTTVAQVHPESSVLLPLQCPN